MLMIRARNKCFQQRAAILQKKYQSIANKRVTTKDLGNGIINVQLSRPEKLNSLDMKMFESIVSVAKDFKSTKSTRVIILSGEGRAFCSGLDLSSLLQEGNPIESISKLLKRNKDEKKVENIYNLAQEVGYIWRTFPIPVIAVLHGVSFGGGMQIALGADMRFSTPTCKISLLESKFGLIPDMSASITLRELVRIDVAKELSMTGKIITGTEAAELGLVTRTMDDPMQEALNVAKQIVSRSPDSVSACKLLFQEVWSNGIKEKDCLNLESELQHELIGSWNQIAATGKSFGIPFLPYITRKSFKVERNNHGIDTYDIK